MCQRIPPFFGGPIFSGIFATNIFLLQFLWHVSTIVRSNTQLVFGLDGEIPCTTHVHQVLAVIDVGAAELCCGVIDENLNATESNDEQCECTSTIDTTKRIPQQTIKCSKKVTRTCTYHRDKIYFSIHVFNRCHTVRQCRRSSLFVFHCVHDRDSRRCFMC